MLRVEWEPLTRLLDSGLEDMAHDHWLEAAIDQTTIPLALDWSRMFSMERDGVFKAASLRRHGELIGYSGYTIAPHIHHRLTRYATNSAIYVKPERRGFAGGKLALACESLLRVAGAQKVVYAVPEIGRAHV